MSDLIERLNDAWRKLYGDGDEHDVCDTIAEAAAALEAAREDAYVALVVDIRLACGDNGKRMQSELVDYIRGLAADAERYRWLRDREIPEWLDLWHQNPDRIDAAIDAALRERLGEGA